MPQSMQWFSCSAHEFTMCSISNQRLSKYYFQEPKENGHRQEVKHTQKPLSQRHSISGFPLYKLIAALNLTLAHDNGSNNGSCSNYSHSFQVESSLSVYPNFTFHWHTLDVFNLRKSCVHRDLIENVLVNKPQNKSGQHYRTVNWPEQLAPQLWHFIGTWI